MIKPGKIQIIIKTSIYRRRGVKIGKGVMIHGSIDSVNPKLVSIGDFSVLAKNAHIITHGPVSPGPVTIGKYVFIGYGSLILPNITIGKGALIGAGSIVTKNVAPYTIVAGNPAKMIGKRDKNELIKTIRLIKQGKSVGKIEV